MRIVIVMSMVLLFSGCSAVCGHFPPTPPPSPVPVTTPNPPPPVVTPAATSSVFGVIHGVE